jgi:uncharacterized protein
MNSTDLNESNRQALLRHIRAFEEEGDAAGALYAAVRHGFADEIQRLLDAGVDVNARREYDGTTPLMVATVPKIAKLLIDRGADVNARDNEGTTPLLWFLRGLAHKRTAEKYIRMLLEAGADVRVQTLQGDTLQTLAEPKYGPEIAKLLEPK